MREVEGRRGGEGKGRILEDALRMLRMGFYGKISMRRRRAVECVLFIGRWRNGRVGAGRYFEPSVVGGREEGMMKAGKKGEWGDESRDPLTSPRALLHPAPP